MKRILLVLTVVFSIGFVHSQTITLNFPHFAGQEWFCSIFSGAQPDTIATGQLDAQGKATVTFAGKYKNYRGMALWRLKQGGGLDMVIAGGENFSVTSPEAQPSEETIVYTHSPENNYLSSRYRRQQEILGKVDAMRMAIQVYKDDKKLLPVFDEELQKQEQAYNRLQAETADSHLYAARFAQIVDVTRGLPPLLPSQADSTAVQLNGFIVKDIDLMALYTSGHWQGVFDSWFAGYAYDKDNLLAGFITDAQHLLGRAPSDEIYTELAATFIASCQKNGWDEQGERLAYTMLNSGRISKPTAELKKLLEAFKLVKGSKAPALAQGMLPKGKLLLVFYQAGCGPCENEMQQLKGNYPVLKGKGYEVVSISADTDVHIFANTAGTFPWHYKYCDLKGFNGDDFTNYGVIGTPTFFLVDDKGIIQGRYARFEDMGLLK